MQRAGRTIRSFSALHRRITETENATGEAFGDRQLERLLRNHRLQPAPEFSRQVLVELQRWRPVAANQEDDITLIVVDVL